MNSSLQNFIKNDLCKSRGEELETETEILRDRDETRPETWDLRPETWDLRDRDFKKRVSRPRPSLETPSLLMCVSIWDALHSHMGAGERWVEQISRFHDTAC